VSFDLSYRLISASHINEWIGLTLGFFKERSHACKFYIFAFVSPFWLLTVKFPEIKSRVPTNWDKTRIILEPWDLPNQTVMFFEHIIYRVFRCVEFEYAYVIVILAREEMSTVRKHNFTAIFNIAYILVRNYFLFKNVHQADTVGKASYHMKSRRMKSDAECFVIECLIYF